MKEAKIILSRIDIAALVVALAGLVLSLVVLAILAVMDFARLASSCWANHDQRWLAVVLGLAMAWVVVRWKYISTIKD